MFAGVVENGVLHRPEQLVDVLLSNAQHLPGQVVEDRLVHLLGGVLLPAPGQQDLGAGSQMEGHPQLLHPLQAEPQIGGEAHNAGGEGGAGKSGQGSGRPVQVGDIPALLHPQGVEAPQGRGEEGQPEHGPGDPGGIGPVGLVAQHHVVGRAEGDQSVPPAQLQHHGDLREHGPPVEAHPAKPAAGPRGGDLHPHPPLGHGEQGVALEEQGGHHGDGGQVPRLHQSF